MEETYSGSTTTLQVANGYADGWRERYAVTSFGFNAYGFDPQGSLNVEDSSFNTTLPCQNVYVYDGYGNRLVGERVSTGSTTAFNIDPVQFGGQYGYYTDVSTGEVQLTHRYYDASTGHFLNRDPIGYSGGQNLYAFCGNNPITGSDPDGTDWLDNAANFSAGAGDSLTFGATGLARQALGVNSVVNEQNGWYIGGELTETAVEIVATGGSAALKHAAERAVERGVAQGLTRRAAKAAIRDAGDAAIAEYREAVHGVGTPHHIHPLRGHPINLTGMKPKSTLFPTGGLNAAIHSGRWNIQFLEHGAHMAAHSRMIFLERGAEVLFNRYTIPARIIRNVWVSRGH